MEKSITADQKKQIKRFAKDAVDRAITEGLLDKDSIQNFIKNGDKFQSDIVASIKKYAVPNQYANEKVRFNHNYPNEYKVKGITDQVATLRQLFPELKDATFDESISSRPLPLNAEGWFAIPRWEKIAPTYGEATQKVLDLIKQTRNGKFYNYREGRLGPQYLRQSQKTSKAFQKLGDEQKGYDILIVPCQFGLRHLDHSVFQAREVMNVSEFGLGTFAVGTMLLTHPERFIDHDNLWIDCAGDEFSPNADGDFSGALIFDFSVGGVGFGSFWNISAHGFYGSASAFLSQ